MRKHFKQSPVLDRFVGAGVAIGDNKTSVAENIGAITAREAGCGTDGIYSVFLTDDERVLGLLELHIAARAKAGGYARMWLKTPIYEAPFNGRAPVDVAAVAPIEDLVACIEHVA